jgi:hypothetical protein
VCPQSEILLQIVADMIDGQLLWEPVAAPDSSKTGRSPR